MSSLNDISTRGDDNGSEIPSNKKECTSCEQKVEHCNKDDVDHNTSSNSSSGIDAISDSIERIGISNNNDDDDDEKLFQEPPPKEDCPICMQPMPHHSGLCGIHTVYMACCGKLLCEACSIVEDNEMKKGNIKYKCSLCRVPLARSDKENMKRLKIRMKLKDAEAFHKLGVQYYHGSLGLPKDTRHAELGLPQDMNKALELWTKSAELGQPSAHYCLAYAYLEGNGTEKDIEKAFHHWKLAAIGGHEAARHNIGVMEINNGNMHRATKHFVIAARAGYDESLKKVGKAYKEGHVTKDDYAKTLRAYQVSVDEMKSYQRTKATDM